MTREDKEDKPQRQSIEALFDEADLISSYTDRQAVDDGILFAVSELGKISPSTPWERGPFQYVTTNLCYTKGYLQLDKPVQVANFLDLFRQVVKTMQKNGPDHFYSATVEFPTGERGDVYAVQNESGRYTILLPEDY